MLLAYLDWAFPRKYDNGDRGIVYSHLFQNRFQRQKQGRRMFTLVVHDPPDEWVQLEVMRSRGGQKRRENQMWRIRGLFKFNYNSREPGETPVLHANPITEEEVEPTAVFVNCSNRTRMDQNMRYSIDIDQVATDKREAYIFVDNVGPFVVTLPNNKAERRFSNKLIGVVPLGTRIIRSHHSRANGKVMKTEEFIIDPDTGRLDAVGESRKLED
jgi:hypothetical protein